MKAAVMYEVGKPFRIENLDLAPPKKNEVRVKTVASGICHSDYSVAHGVLRAPAPVVLGHEGAGIITELGPGVTGLAVGDHVIAALSPTCGECEMCREGKPYMCAEMSKANTYCTMSDGTTRLSQNGKPVHQLCAIASFAEEMVIPAGAAIRIDSDVALESACLIGCGVTTGAGAAMNTAKVKPGTSVAVIGCGGVGLSIIQGARIQGATTIIAIDPVAEKRQLALRLGATHAIDPFHEETHKVVKKLTGGGVHYAFEALGRIETIEQTWKLIRPTGEAIIVGVASLKEQAEISVGGLLAEYGIRGSVYGSCKPKEYLPQLVGLYKSGALKLDEMITRRIPLEEINEAFAAMGRGEGARTVIVFD